MPSRQVIICNHRGLHARAAAKMVRTAEKFDADLTVSRDGQAVSARSIMGLMMLAASIGTQITIDSSGPEAEAALAAAVSLVEEKFGEES